jgi:hypothetical protein
LPHSSSVHGYDFLYVIAIMVWGWNHSMIFHFIVRTASFTFLGVLHLPRHPAAVRAALKSGSQAENHRELWQCDELYSGEQCWWLASAAL